MLWMHTEGILTTAAPDAGKGFPEEKCLKMSAGKFRKMTKNGKSGQ